MKNKKYLRIIIVLVLIFVESYGTIANYNHFPTLKPLHVLDTKLTNISFAFSMRVLNSDYDGPLIRLRRAGDNAQKDFGWGDNDIVDINAINIWRNGNNVYVHTWYDQSALGRDAVQVMSNMQPQFYADETQPYFTGDGNNDHLSIDTPNGIQDVTNAGDEGTVLVVLNPTNKTQHTFGVLTGGNRWSTHVNWSNGSLYFDPGFVHNPRTFSNSSATGVWKQYTFMKTNSNVIIRKNGLDKVNASRISHRCTRTEDFAIGWATGDGNDRYATTSFMEMIMYKIDLSAVKYEEIENNIMTFWGL